MNNINNTPFPPVFFTPLLKGVLTLSIITAVACSILAALNIFYPTSAYIAAGTVIFTILTLALRLICYEPDSDRHFYGNRSVPDLPSSPSTCSPTQWNTCLNIPPARVDFTRGECGLEDGCLPGLARHPYFGCYGDDYSYMGLRHQLVWKLPASQASKLPNGLHNRFDQEVQQDKLDLFLVIIGSNHNRPVPINNNIVLHNLVFSDRPASSQWLGASAQIALFHTEGIEAIDIPLNGTPISHQVIVHDFDHISPDNAKFRLQPNRPYGRFYMVAQYRGRTSICCVIIDNHYATSELGNFIENATTVNGFKEALHSSTFCYKDDILNLLTR